MKYLISIIPALLLAQSTPLITIIPDSAGAVGLIRLREPVAGGSSTFSLYTESLSANHALIFGNGSIRPTTAAALDLGSTGEYFSNSYSTNFLARVATGTFAGVTASGITGGEVYAQNSSGTTQAIMNANGFNTGAAGNYRVNGTEVISSGRVLTLASGANVGSSLNPTGTFGLGSSNSVYWATNYLRNIITDGVVPDSAWQSTSTVGTSGVRFQNGYFVNMNISGTCTGCGGITTLNTLTGTTQTFATGTSGSNFNISSSGTTHTFNIPDASGSNRGLVTTGTQSFAGNKTFTNNMTTESILPASAGTKDIGSSSLYYSNTWSTVFNARVSTGTFAGMNASTFSGGQVYVQNTSGTTMALMDQQGFDTGSTGDYQVQGTTVISSGRVLTLASGGNVSSGLLPTSSSTYNLGGSSNRWNQIYGASLDVSGGATVGGSLSVSSSASFSNGVNVNGATSFFRSIEPQSGNTYNLGSSSFRWANGYFTSLDLSSSGSLTAYVGSGNFYNRTFSGSPSCSGVTDGWTGIDTFNLRIWVCVSGTARYATLN